METAQGKSPVTLLHGIASVIFATNFLSSAWPAFLSSPEDYDNLLKNTLTL